jgi:tetratricopeptide (TPR) repeat protein
MRVSASPALGLNVMVSATRSALRRRSFSAARFRRSGTRTAPAAFAVIRADASAGRPCAAAATAHIERSAALAQELGLEQDVIIANTNLADLALTAGDLEGARRRLEKTLAWNHEHGLAAEDDSFALLGLGTVEHRSGRLDEAAERFDQALRLAERAGFHHNAALALVGLAAVAADRMDHAQAAVLLGRAGQLGELAGADAER